MSFEKGEIHNIKWLRDNHLKAYEALPEAYREDDCLMFYEQYGSLHCNPRENQIEVLGDWCMMFRVCPFNGSEWAQVY